MGSLLLLVALAVVVLGALAILSALKGRGGPGSADEAAFEARRELFSPAERSFFGVLEQAVLGEFKVLGKVRLGDLIQPAKGLPPSRRASLRNRVQQKHVDFVLCCPDTLAAVAAVELDDATHRRKDRAERDDFVDRALVTAGVPVLRFPARKGYAVAEIREGVAAALDRKGVESALPKATEAAQAAVGHESPAPTAVAAVAETTAAATVTPREGSAPSATKTPAAPVCPACNVPMIKRQAQKGPNAGKWFWACTGYPKCRKVLAVR